MKPSQSCNKGKTVKVDSIVRRQSLAKLAGASEVSNLRWENSPSTATSTDPDWASRHKVACPPKFNYELITKTIIGEWAHGEAVWYKHAPSSTTGNNSHVKFLTRLKFSATTGELSSFYPVARSRTENIKNFDVQHPPFHLLSLLKFNPHR